MSEAAHVMSDGECWELHTTPIGDERSWKEFEEFQRRQEKIHLWQRYLKYLEEWAWTHDNETFIGMSPAGWDEWVSNGG